MVNKENIQIHPEDIARFSDVRVLVVGDVMLDEYIYGRAEKISPEAPIPILEAETSKQMLGGAGNVCVNISHLGGEIALLSVVGKDEKAKRIHHLLEEIDVEGNSILFEDASRPTIVKRRFVSEGQQLLRVDRESKEPLAEALEDQILESAASKMPYYDVLILSDYAKGVLSNRLSQKLIQLASQHDCYVMVDPKGSCYKKYSGADMIKPNLKELALVSEMSFTDEAAIAKAASHLAEEYAIDAVIVTMGAKGILGKLRKKSELFSWPSFAREVVDVSGAGDTVISTLALSIGSGIDLKKAMLIASHAACCVVEKRGTASLLPDELLKQSSYDQFHKLQESFLSLEDMVELRLKWKEQGLVVGFTNGCFDLLHPGHIRLLQKGKRGCDRLIVGLNSDSSVRKLKGEGRPIQDEQARAMLLLSQEMVDGVVPFSEETPQNVIEALTPDYLFKGGEYEADKIIGAEWVKKHGGRVEIIDSGDNTHTSELIRKMS